MTHTSTNGKEKAYHSIMYKSISHLSMATAGTFDMAPELKAWISGNLQPLISKKLKKIATYSKFTKF
ncbi:PH domain-containing protein [Saliterribacillus persicus]|uniref:PH domain-containing protein n=1 Tax=Saliterribacillus persicus TaxID=930114 RepID=UPI003CCC6BE0